MSQALRIGLNVYPHDPFWVLVREAIDQRARQADVQLVPVNIDRARARGLRHSEPMQADLVEELQAQELQALITTYLPEALVQRILDSGLPVIFNSETPLRHPRLVSPASLYDAARMIGQYLVERLSGRGLVLIAGGLMGPGDNGQSRVAGLSSVLDEFPHIRQRHIPSPWMMAYSYFEAGLRELTEPLDAIFGLSDSLALAAADAGRAAGLVTPRTLIVGINGDPLALAAIAEGTMTATAETDAAFFGDQMVELACQAARGEALPSHFDYQLRLVTADNVTESMKHKLVAIAKLPSHLIGVNRQQEQKRLAQLESSLAISRRISAMLDRQQLVRDMADLIRTNYGYDEVYLYLWSAAEQTLTLDRPRAARQCIPLAQAGVVGQAVFSHEPIFIPDVQRSARFSSDPAYPATRSRVTLPIRLSDTVLGVLDLHSHRLTHYTRQELLRLQLLAEQLGAALCNADLYDQAVQARAVAEKADQLKTRLLANVSHELRTPLNVIMGYSQAALASPNPYGIELPPELGRDLGRIYNSGEHLMRLINDLLDLSRAEIGELNLVPETIAPHTFLEEVFHSIAGSAPSAKQVAWLMNLPERLPLIQADPVRLRQVLLNLLANARKFTTAGHILLGAEVEPPHLHIWVEDTGWGIPVDQQARIFEPFVTVASGTAARSGRRGGAGAQRTGVVYNGVGYNEGIGLGLAVTRRLVALHGGSMTLESQVGQGSTFHVYLPLPSLSGALAAEPAMPALHERQPALLIISTSATPAGAIDKFRLPRDWQIAHLRPGDPVDQRLAELHPMTLAWDMGHASPGEWMLIQQIRNHPLLCRLPLILFGQEGADECGGVTGVVTKPLSGNTLADLLESLRPAQAGGPVLIVDDDPQARCLYQSIAERALPGYPIRQAENGAAALAALADQAPALVILDLTMPEVDGFAVLEHLRADGRTCHVPVLVMSGRILSAQDIKRLDHAHVVVQSKGILSDDETAASLRRTLEGEGVLPQATSTLVKHTLAYIQRNYARPLTRAHIAQAVGVSEDYLGRIFQHELGLSPIEYLNRCRIKEAKALLLHTGVSITDVAAQVGFDDPAYFSRAFRKQVGVSPRVFRAQAAS